MPYFSQRLHLLGVPLLACISACRIHGAGEARAGADASNASPEDDAGNSAADDAQTDDTSLDSDASTDDAAADDDAGNPADAGPQDAGHAWGPPDAAPPSWPSAPSTPHSIRPWNGETTGDTWGTRARRPTFRWTEVARAKHYELELDSQCSGAPSACSFAAPTIQTSVTEPSFTPDTDLPTSATSPVGRRYYWRWRSCDAAACAAWSATRYVDVARQQRDYNGDGYADVLLYPPGSAVPGEVFNGGATSDTTPDWSIGVVSGANAVVSIGDANGDGFADWAEQSTPVTSVDSTSYAAWAGSNEPAREQIWQNSQRGKYSTPGSFVGVGDLDADGRADVVTAWSGIVRGAFLGLSRPGSLEVVDAPGPDLTGADRNSVQLSGIGDIDGDGFADIARLDWYDPRSDVLRLGGVPNRYALTVLASTGNALTSAASSTIATLWQSGESPPFSALGPGDIDGDSQPDLLVASDGKLRVYLRRDAIMVPHTSISAGLAWSTGDVNGDGMMDIAVAAAESVSIYYGGRELQPGPTLSVPGIEDVDFSGDVNGDGYADLVARVGDATWRLFLGGLSIDDASDATFTLPSPR
jgi:hypothetical protein